tara:strand:+ start:6176 stop:6580 length:405 start_codon:yes stop_codon:yes gene_type:complete
MNRADIEEWIAHPNAALNRMTIADFKALCKLALRNLKADEPTNREKIYGPLLDKLKPKAGEADVWLAVESHNLELAALRTRAEEAERKLAQARAECMEEAAKACEKRGFSVQPEMVAACNQCARDIRAKMKEIK